jgi:hypothetical protein
VPPLISLHAPNDMESSGASPKSSSLLGWESKIDMDGEPS